MRTFGLIGYPLTHSFSKGYFNEKFGREKITDCIYNNYSIDSIDKIIHIIDNDTTIIGLNVTIPYKEKVIEFLDEMDEISSNIGAVNTIKIIRGTKILLKGYNTDAFGFYNSIKPHLNKKHNNALILGTGGASKSVAYVFKELGITVKYVSRNPGNTNQFSYNDLNGKVLSDFRIIVNTSPIGMYPKTNAMPDIPYDFIGSNHILFDLIYNPQETAFLKKGNEQGALVINGLQMLHLQAEKAWEIWNSE